MLETNYRKRIVICALLCVTIGIGASLLGSTQPRDKEVDARVEASAPRANVKIMSMVDITNAPPYHRGATFQIRVTYANIGTKVALNVDGTLSYKYSGTSNPYIGLSSSNPSPVTVYIGANAIQTFTVTVLSSAPTALVEIDTSFTGTEQGTGFPLSGESGTYDADVNIAGLYIQEDYEGYTDGAIPSAGHTIIGTSDSATYTVEALTGNKVGWFNDADSAASLTVGLDIDRDLQDGDQLKWDIKLLGIQNGKSAYSGLFTAAQETLLLISAYESSDGLVHKFFVLDGSGSIEILVFTLDTWYTFEVTYHTGGTYSLGINGTSIISSRALLPVGTSVKYLAFLDLDGTCNWEGYIDNVKTHWP